MNIKEYTRTEEEDYFYNFLLESVESKDIKEPDKECPQDGGPDFLINKYNLVIEVKKICITKEHIEHKKEKERTEQELKTGKSTAFFVPVRCATFSDHLDNTRKKFRKYPNYGTIMVEDLREYGKEYYPSPPELLRGFEEFTIDDSDRIKRHRIKERHIRKDKNTEIGAILFIFENHYEVWHNVMAESNRRVGRKIFKGKNIIEYEFDINNTNDLTYKLIT